MYGEDQETGSESDPATEGYEDEGQGGAEGSYGDTGYDPDGDGAAGDGSGQGDGTGYDQPPDLEVPTVVYADGAGDQLDSSMQNLCWDFCLLFLGRPWASVQGCGPSPQDAATAVGQLVQQLNQLARQMGYPPNCISATNGPC